MKTRNLFFGLFAALAIAGCSSEDAITSDGGNSEVGDGDSRYLTVNIVSNGAGGTRADNPGQQFTSGNNTYEYGLANENAVYNARFYFFDDNKAAMNIAIAGNKAVNYVDCVPEAGDPNGANIEKTLKATVVLETSKKDDELPTKMVAVLNATGTALGGSTLDASLSYDDLMAILAKNSTYYTKSGKTGDNAKYFVMSSSVYLGADNTIQCPATILKDDQGNTKANLQKSKSEAEEHPVQVYVERMAAKVRVRIDGTTNIPENDKKTLTDGVIIYKAKVSGSEHGTDNSQYDYWQYITTGGAKKDIYVKFTGWELTNTATESYLFKSINTGWVEKNVPFANWNDATNYRCYWAISPLTDNKIALNNSNIKIESSALNLTGVFYTSSDVSTTTSPGNYSNVSGTKLQYCLENAADNTNGTKSTYNADEALSNRTQVVIGAQLCDENGNALNLAQWRGFIYDQSVAEYDVKTMMLEQANIALSGQSPTITLTANDVELVSAENAITTEENTTTMMANKNSQNSKRYLTYLQLSSSSSYYSGDNKNAINKILSGVTPCKKWDNGLTYYYTDIQHLPTATDDTKGKYGVVRNHIYDVVINNFTGIGTPASTDSYKDYIIPQKTQEEYWYLAAAINILSWRWVQNSTTLDW